MYVETAIFAKYNSSVVNIQHQIEEDQKISGRRSSNTIEKIIQISRKGQFPQEDQLKGGKLNYENWNSK